MRRLIAVAIALAGCGGPERHETPVAFGVTAAGLPWCDGAILEPVTSGAFGIVDNITRWRCTWPCADLGDVHGVRVSVIYTAGAFWQPAVDGPGTCD